MSWSACPRSGVLVGLLFFVAMGASCSRQTETSFRGIGSPLEGMIPAIEVEENKNFTDFQIVLRKEYADLAMVDDSAQLIFSYQTAGKKKSHDPVVLEKVRFERGEATPQRTYSDLSGAKVQVSGKVSVLKVQVASDAFKDGPWLKDLLRGDLQISLKGGSVRLGRKFEKIPDGSIDQVPSIEVEKIKSAYEKSRADSESSEAEISKLVLPVTFFDAKPFVELENHQWLIRSLLSSFDAVWAKPCGIRLEIENYTFLKEKGSGVPGSLVAEMSPELLYLGHKIRSAIGTTRSKTLVISNVGIEWPSKHQTETSVNPLGYALSFHRAGFEFFSHERPLSFQDGVVFLENTVAAEGLSHELGHLLLGDGHESDPENLMYPVVGGTKISSEQCLRARATLQK